METAKYHPAVELILSRMESNPQEFTYEGGRWRHTIEQHTRWMTKEEKEVINEKLRTINLDFLRTSMLKKIVSEQSRPMPVADDGGGGYVVGSSFGSAVLAQEGTAVNWASNTNTTINIDGETLTADDFRAIREIIAEKEY